MVGALVRLTASEVTADMEELDLLAAPPWTCRAMTAPTKAMIDVVTGTVIATATVSTVITEIASGNGTGSALMMTGTMTVSVIAATMRIVSAGVSETMNGNSVDATAIMTVRMGETETVITDVTACQIGTRYCLD